MLQNIVRNILGISLAMSVMIVFLCILMPLLDKRYGAKLKYYMWLVVVLQLLIPITISMPRSPIQFDTSQIVQESKQISTAVLERFELTNQFVNQGSIQAQTKTNSFLERYAFLWVLGAVAFFLLHLLCYWSNIKRIRRWSHGAEPFQIQIFDQLKADMHIKGNIGLLKCTMIKSPMMYGMFHANVLIPCNEYTETDLLLILKHELIHYQKHHIPVKIVVFLANTIHWFNPFVYLLSNKISQAMELCCDEYVVHDLDINNRKRYMETLLRSVKTTTMVDMPLFTTNYIGGSKMMKKRFENIKFVENRKKGMITFGLLFTLCVGMGSLVGCKTEVATGTKSDLPKGIECVYGETERNTTLEKTIISGLEIPEEFIEQTTYYYNYVDLNKDGIDEIFAVVMGPYTSGTGGSSGLVIEPTEDSMEIKQIFTLIQTPLVVSETMTNGYKELIANYSGGGEKGTYVVLKYDNGSYTPVSEGEEIENFNGVKGTAIICNDIAKEREEEKALFLQK